MYRRKEDIRIRKIENPRGGNGVVYFHDFLLPEEAPGHGSAFSKFVVTPGSCVGYHQHVGDMEALYILQGVGTLTENGEQIQLYPGDMALCPPDGWHSFQNNGTEDVVAIALMLNDLTKK